MLVRYPHRPLGPATAWRWGFLHTLWISRKSDEGDGVVETVLGRLLDHPSTRFLRELTVGIVSYQRNSYAGVARVIGERSLPALRGLILGDFFYEETELNWSHAGDLSPLWRAVPKLESLTVRSGDMELGKLVLPELRELTIITGGFDSGSLAAICNQTWPALERLNVQLGRAQRFTHEELAPILDGDRFPKLVQLGLGNSRGLDEICRWLAGSRIAARLEKLDLSKGTMGDDGAAALAAGHFPKLVSLDVSKNWLGGRGVATLDGTFRTVISDAQQDDDGDPDDRYIAAYE